MRRNRTTLWIALVVGGALGLGCSTYPTFKNVSAPVDCEADKSYDVNYVVDNFETPGMAPNWTSGDTLTANVSASIVPLAETDRCGAKAALRIVSSHNNDWGSLSGFNFGPRDESTYEGLAFWAKAPGNTTKWFTWLLDDPNTVRYGLPEMGNCKTYALPDGGPPTGTIYDPATNMPISGTTTSAPPPDACGNGYSVPVVVTADWRYYTIPFASFKQAATPNRVPNTALMETGTAKDSSLITSKLVNLILRMPKEAEMELWLDDLAFYRKKAPGTGVGADAGMDAGADAPRM